MLDEVPMLKPLAPLIERADEEMVAMRDGVRLATDLYLPSGPGPFPTVLTRFPYDKCDVENLVEPMAVAANERGYAFVAQDTRGKARSEGEPQAFVGEALDGYDTLEWVASRGWCDGRVAMSGMSYPGFTQWAAVASGHPALRAIVPHITTSLVGRDWIWRQGVFELGLVAGWSALTWSDTRLYGFDLELDWSVRPLWDVIPGSLGGRRSASFDRMARLAEHDPFWTQTALVNRVPAQGMTIPALHIGGWWDYFQRGQIADWALASGTSAAPQLLVMDAIDHWLAEWELEPAGPPDMSTFSSDELAGFGEAVMARPLEFLDVVLNGRDHGKLTPVSWQLTHGERREADRWPPREARPRSLYLTADGDARGAAGARLAGDPPTDGGWTRWTHDPTDLVPSSGVPNGMADLAIPADDTTVEARPDVLVFTTEPLSADLDLAGPIVADLQVGSTAPVMHVVVRLLDVFPDGRTRRIRDGAALVRHAEQDPRVHVDLGHTGYRVGSGHRLRVHIASSDFPRYLPYFGDDRDPWTATEGPSNEQRLRVGGLHGSRVVVTSV